MAHIIIVGGGFGGIQTAHYLGKHLPRLHGPGNLPSPQKEHHITLIDEKNYHRLHFNFYEIATVFLRGRNEKDYESAIKVITIPFYRIFPPGGRIRVVHDSVAGISLKDKKVFLKRNGLMTYDYAVIALGSETNYYDIPGAREYGLPMKDFNEALNIRNKIEEAFYLSGGKEIRVTIAGGGFSGCELAAELVFFLKKLEKKYEFKNKFSVSIIEAGPSILRGTRTRVVELATERLTSLGITLFLNSTIKKVAKNTIALLESESEEKKSTAKTRLDSARQAKKTKLLEYDVLIWTAGIAPSRVTTATSGAEFLKGCLIVNQKLQIGPLKDAFAVGDNTYCYDEKSKVRIPATAYYAMEQGIVAAKNIIRSIERKPLEEYFPRKPVFAIPLGSKYAIVDLNFIIIKGFAGWLLRHLVSLKYYFEILPWRYAARFWLSSMRLFIKND